MTFLSKRKAWFVLIFKAYRAEADPASNIRGADFSNIW